MRVQQCPGSPGTEPPQDQRGDPSPAGRDPRVPWGCCECSRAANSRESSAAPRTINLLSTTPATHTQPIKPRGTPHKHQESQTQRQLGSQPCKHTDWGKLRAFATSCCPRAGHSPARPGQGRFWYLRWCPGTPEFHPRLPGASSGRLTPGL